MLGALLGFLNVWLGIWRDGRKKSADSTYLAVRLTVILEAYAAACADLISRNNMAEIWINDDLPRWDIRLPTLTAFPDDGDGWKALDPNLASECLGLRNKIDGSQGMISETIEHDEMEIGRSVQMQASERGLEAWSLAQRLRKAHRLRPVELVFRYDDFLKKEIERAKAREKRRNRDEEDIVVVPAA